MASSKHKEAEGEAPSGVDRRFAKFHLDDRPQRKPGQNAYFDDIKEQIARNQQSDDRDASEVTKPQPANLDTGKPDSSSTASAENSEIDGDRDDPNDPTQKTEIRVRALAIHSHGKKRTPEIDKATVSSLTPLPSIPTQTSFDNFKRLWGPFLKNKQMELCEVLFNQTIALGRTEFITKTDDLCKAVDVSSRHLLYLLRQLEKLGFVTRHDEKTDTNKTLGKRITFQPFPPR